MGYQALYRTWRPEYFRDIVGQDRIVTTLINQITSGRIPHAYLFCGSRGTGKTTTAKVLTRAINCLSPENGEPCGHCEACRQLINENNLDTVEIDAASNNGVDNIRELIDKVKYPPTIGHYKVYIIDEVHMLSTGAFNALLKTLEEPPAHAVFILATTEPQKLPATILSRCQRFDFKRIPATLIEKRLEQVVASDGDQVDHESIALIARAAEGGMRDALSILDMCLSYGSGKLDADVVRDVLGASDRSFLFDFVGALIANDAAHAISLIDRVMRDGRDPAVFCREVTGHARSLLVAKTCSEGLEDLLELTAEDAQRLREQASGASQARLMRIMDLFIQAENDMKWATQQRVVLELNAVRACHPEREQGEEALEDRIAVLEKTVAEGVTIAPAPSAASAKDAPQQPSPKVTPAPKKSAPPPENEEQAWKQAVLAIGRVDGKIGMFLKKGRFIGVKDGAATIEYPSDGSEVIVQLLNKPEKKETIDKVVGEIFGSGVHFRAMVQGASTPKGTTGQGKARLDKVYEAFPRDKIEIVDEQNN